MNFHATLIVYCYDHTASFASSTASLWKWYYEYAELFHPLLTSFIMCTPSAHHANICKYLEVLHKSSLYQLRKLWNKPNLKNNNNKKFKKGRHDVSGTLNSSSFITWGRGKQHTSLWESWHTDIPTALKCKQIFLSADYMGWKKSLILVFFHNFITSIIS